MYADIVGSLALFIAFGGLYYTFINFKNLKSNKKFELLTKLNTVTYKYKNLDTELKFIEDRILKVKTIDLVGDQLNDLHSKIVSQKDQVNKMINRSGELYEDNSNRRPCFKYLYKMNHFADSANELYPYIKKDLKPYKLTFNNYMETIHKTALLPHKIKIID